MVLPDYKTLIWISKPVKSRSYVPETTLTFCWTEAVKWQTSVPCSIFKVYPELLFHGDYLYHINPFPAKAIPRSDSQTSIPSLLWNNNLIFAEYTTIRAHFICKNISYIRHSVCEGGLSHPRCTDVWRFACHPAQGLYSPTVSLPKLVWGATSPSAIYV
jgi:hypothetical protein